MSILETRNLRKIYGSGDTEVRALDGVNLSVDSANLSPLWAPPAPGNPPFCTCWAALTGPPPAA